MLLAGLKCAQHGDVPLDHFEEQERLRRETRTAHVPSGHRPPMPLPWIAAILKVALGDERHADNKITATRLLTCPRETVIQDNIPTFLDPRAHNSLEWGNAMHAHMEQNAEPGKYPELAIPPPGVEPPIIFGIPVSGHIDMVAPDFSVIEDYKGHSEGAQRYASGKQDTVVQLNIYRVLIAKCILNVDPSTYTPELVAWHGAPTSAKGPPPWIPEVLPIWSEEQMAKFKPKGGAYTVEQIVQMYVRAHGLIAQVKADGSLTPEQRLKAYKAITKSMPLAGREMMGGKKCTTYCVVADLCDDLEGILRP